MQSLWMIVAAGFFAIMAACVKLASDDYTTSEILLCRGIFGVLFILSLIRLRGGTLKTPYIKQHIVRSLYGTMGLWSFFYALTILPLAMATTLNYMSPIWIACILFLDAWRRGNNHFDITFIATIVLSFVGVIMLLKPSAGGYQITGGLIALLSGIVTALAYIKVKELSLLGEPEYRVVFYFSVICAISGLIGSMVMGQIPFFHPQSPKAIILLLTIGIVATLAQMALTRAYRLGNTLLTANLQYFNIICTSILNIVIWHNSLDWMGWSGIGLILLCGIAATFHQRTIVRKTLSKSV